MEQGHQAFRVEGVRVNSITDRINAVAQRLDELADDGSSELTTLAEELGRIADDWSTGAITHVGKEATPEWLRRIQREIERAAMEIVSQRYEQNHTTYGSGAYFTIAIPNPQSYAANEVSKLFKVPDSVV